MVIKNLYIYAKDKPFSIKYIAYYNIINFTIYTIIMIVTIALSTYEAISEPKLPYIIYSINLLSFLFLIGYHYLILIINNRFFKGSSISYWLLIVLLIPQIVMFKFDKIGYNMTNSFLNFGPHINDTNYFKFNLLAILAIIILIVKYKYLNMIFTKNAGNTSANIA